MSVVSSRDKLRSDDDQDNFKRVQERRLNLLISLLVIQNDIDGRLLK